MAASISALGTCIRDARLARGWTREQFGAKVGRSKSTVSVWESDKHPPRLAELRRIARILRADYEALQAAWLATASRRKAS